MYEYCFCLHKQKLDINRVCICPNVTGPGFYAEIQIIVVCGAWCSGASVAKRKIPRKKEPIEATGGRG